MRSRSCWLFRFFAVNPMYSTGIDDVFSLDIVGLSISFGSWARIPSTFDRTSLTAASMFWSRLKLATTTDMPSCDVEVTSRRPLTPDTASSIFRETSVFTSSGFAPG